MLPSPKQGQGQPAPVKIYNAVYSSVQVYECMVRGIAVMRRRQDSYVNATQILKVAGVDKGRRTKILEKEILPGRHEIVQGGYGKYQGTWIPLEKGREIATQYGVAPLLAPLFDFVPSTNTFTTLPIGAPRPLTASASLPGMSVSSTSSTTTTPGLAPAPIMPGSALRLLNQGRAQGLFTPSTSAMGQQQHQQQRGTPMSPFFSPAPYGPGVSPTPPPAASSSSATQQNLKRTHSDTEATARSIFAHQGSPPVGAGLLSTDVQMTDASRPTPTPSPIDEDIEDNEDDGPSPAKRARKEPTEPSTSQQQQLYQQSFASTSASQPLPTATDTSVIPSKPSSSSAHSAMTPVDSSKPMSRLSSSFSDTDLHVIRAASKPSVPRNMDPLLPTKDQRRSALVLLICQQDDPARVLELLSQIPADNPAVAAAAVSSTGNNNNNSNGNHHATDWDLVLDEHGHTALHLAASMGRQQTVDALILAGADIHRGNYLGETPLMRACLATHNADAQTFNTLVTSLHGSIRTLDTARKSVIHHIVALAGVKGRAPVARYYLDQVLFWVAHHQGGEFGTLVDLQDEHGDTALNIAARVGNRSLVRTLLDVNANRTLPNKLGLRPGDFGLETEELGGAGPGVGGGNPVGQQRSEDIIVALRSGPSAPVQKSHEFITDITSMVHSLSSEFSAEVKARQDTLDVTQAHLRAATRELAEQRKQIQAWQARCSELDQLSQRVRNLEKAIAEEDKFDWTGRTDGHGEDAAPVAGPSFQWRGASSTIIGVVVPPRPVGLVASTANGKDVAILAEEGVEPPVPTEDTVQALVRLRRLKKWHTRVEEMIASRLKGLQGASAEKEYQCKKIISLCTGIPIDKVEESLENLVIAVESEAQIVDIGRVSGFMQKVRDGVL